VLDIPWGVSEVKMAEKCEEYPKNWFLGFYIFAYDLPLGKSGDRPLLILFLMIL
jgi:hypothetical protein